MGNFRWTDSQGAPDSPNRYFDLQSNRDFAGWSEWEKFITAWRSLRTSADAFPLLNEIRRVRRTTPPRECPRVFVSHRWSDEDLARRIAWLASDEQVEYWLDVIDLPKRLVEGPQALPRLQQETLLAAIIEIALINCTHVIAVMTPQTAGSQWVPYEYGRIKDDPPAELTSSCWRHPDLSDIELPGYLYLAPVFSTESHIRWWLSGERAQFAPRCKGNRAGTWPDKGEPKELPPPREAERE